MPSGAFDVPLLIADRSFDVDNQLVYTFNQFGVVGDHLLVNGVPQPYMDVAARKYRFRVLNAANYRDFRLQLSNGQAMTQIGTEAGLLPAPVSRTSILMGSAERVDLVIDFTGLLGQTITLQNTAATGSQSEIMQFRVNQTAADSSSVPASLRPLPDLGAYTNTRTFDFGFTNGHMTINGLLFDHHRVDAQPDHRHDGTLDFPQRRRRQAHGPRSRRRPATSAPQRAAAICL